MIIMTTKTSILIICPFLRGLLLTYPISPPRNNISSLEFNNLQENATLTKSCTSKIPESLLVLCFKTSISLDNGGLKAAFRAYRELQEGDPARGTHIFQVS